MDWIHSHRGVINHPKTKRLARTLGINRAHAVGILHALWFHAVDVADGDILDIDWDDLAEECFWQDDPTTLVNALITTGWLHPAGEHRLRLHEWWDYGGRTVVAAQAAKQAGLKGAHRRYHTEVKDPSCAWCYPQSTETDSTSTETSPAPSGTDSAPTGNGANTPDSSPPTSPPTGVALAERQERQEKKEQHTHPLETHEDAPERLASVWTGNRSPNQKTTAIARRVITECPELATLTEPQLRRLVAWAKTGGTRTLGGVSHVAPSWPHWPTSSRPLPPWCGDPNCDQTSRIHLDDTGGRPCPTCSPNPIDEALA